MKKRYILEYEPELDFSVLAINSHAKAYKLCWNINKRLNVCFEKLKDQTVNTKINFSRYFGVTEDGVEYNILSNRSKTGYLIPDQKSINYFLITKNRNWRVEKRQIINKLRQNKEVLLVFEFDTQKNKYTDRFFLNDTEN